MASTMELFVYSVLVIPLFQLLPFCSGCLPTEREALLQFKAALNHSSDLSSWEEGGNCCHWEGISCHNTTTRVVSVEMYDFEGGGVISESLCSLTSLSTIRLYYMGLTGTLPPCLGNLSSLSVLDLYSNNLEGETVLTTLCLLSNLSYVDLSDNQLNGSLPSCLGSLSSMTDLSISGNHLSGSIPDSLGNLSLLKFLVLSYNRLNGTLPSSFSRLSSLNILYADGNAFSQDIASSVLPSSLRGLSLSLDGQQAISEAFFYNLTRLKALALSNCVHNISNAWIPPVQLTYLFLISCKVDGQIPLWISTQFSLVHLKLVDNNLTGEIPSWLLGMNILFINLTTNCLQGQLLLDTPGANPLAALDVSTNELSGQIPSIWPPNITVLLLNDNSLTGNIPAKIQGISSLKVVNFANNRLNGVIPPSIANCAELQNLNLGGNNFRGTIPYEFGKLRKLQELVLKNNQLSGSFPPSISNCTGLHLLDVGTNFFSGNILKSIGNISQLKVLAMRKNNFDGNIPAEIERLRNLQILDLSSNRLSGLVPHSIFSLQALMVETHEEFSKVQVEIEAQSYEIDYTYMNGLNLNSKGRDEQYTYIFETMMAIELANNQLNGNLPSDLGKMKGLKLLNISINNFSGAIPNSIVQLSWLETLDFSTNHFFGQIPPDLGSLSYLGALNFSNNHLMGSIPQGGHMTTFSESSYLGNPNLWGCPLPKKCSWPEFTHSPPPISTSVNREEQSEESIWYDTGVGLFHVTGFTIVLVFIVLKKKYFERVDEILKILFPWIRNLTL